jgi:hypothetical protein
LGLMKGIRRDRQLTCHLLTQVVGLGNNCTPQKGPVLAPYLTATAAQLSPPLGLREMKGNAGRLYLPRDEVLAWCRAKVGLGGQQGR